MSGVADTIVMSTVIATGATVVKHVANRDPIEPRVFIGGFIVGAILLAASEVWPDAARMLAMLVAITSLLMNGGVVFAALNRLVNG